MFRAFALSVLSLLAVTPSSTNYTLKAYDLGGGAGGGSSTNYTVSGQAGGQASNGLLSASYALPAGVKASTTVPVPGAPTLTDDNSAYDRLHLTLNVGSAPSDTKYVVAISSDNFTTTQYVQLDDTIGSGISISNYQTYTAWGGASGFYILSLTSNTTYKVKVAALQGSGTGSAFGPIASAATSQPSASFGVTTSLSSSPPFSVTFTSLPASQITTGNATINLSLSTNAVNGGSVLVSDQYTGLKSTAVSTTLASATADLGSAGKGYGAQVTSASQTSGGPLSAASPFNGSGNNIGGLTTAWQSLANFSSWLTGGTLGVSLLAKTDATVPAASDYADTLTISFAPLF
ncbi:MAG TPA: hypothetical protein VJP80_02650 [Candidatus Saccharimonadales bacterium]|nr:hypothetical protein [Candidatus Saccharimonadales bacterium]